MREERLGVDPAGSDPRIAQYRLLARALRHPPLDPVPAGFAASVAARAAHRRPARVDDDRLETWLLRGLLVALVVAGALFAASQGGEWLRATLALLPPASAGSSGAAASWVTLLVACIAASSLLGQWRRGRTGA